MLKKILRAIFGPLFFPTTETRTREVVEIRKEKYTVTLWGMVLADVLLAAIGLLAVAGFVGLTTLPDGKFLWIGVFALAANAVFKALVRAVWSRIGYWAIWALELTIVGFFVFLAFG